MSDDFFGGGQGGGDSSNYKPSTHPFTDPIRYFKANDPYYWEVDNIPLAQLQENVLWLKDQLTVGGVTELGDVSRRNWLELRPNATGADRFVFVQPGRFMGRVNDAYQTGISKLVLDANTNYDNKVFGRQESVVISDDVLSRLVGETITDVVGNNGLYDHLQTHTSNFPATGPVVDWGSYYSVDTRNDLGVTNIYDIPKVKLAIWPSDTTTHSYYGPLPTDLQQRAVEWTRAWGAPFRTALVNVEAPLNIEIPQFSDDDFANESTNIPAVRVDLLFVYTKPVDASSTTIAKPVGGEPGVITSPQLGLVRGAGVIALKGKGGWSSETIDSTFLDSTTYTDNKADQTQAYWFKDDNTFDSKNNPQISAPTGDQFQTDIGTSGVYGNFPSPDDLMNLAPYLTSELANTNSVSLVGQSILPLAYIFVHKGQTNISDNDILDIRPFFRTAELTYNERSGLAAANPPVSIANPVVSDRDISNRLERLYETIVGLIPPPQGPPTQLIAAKTYKLQAKVSTDMSRGAAPGIVLIGPEKSSIDPSGLISLDVNSKYVSLKKGYAYSVLCAGASFINRFYLGNALLSMQLEFWSPDGTSSGNSILKWYLERSKLDNTGTKAYPYKYSLTGYTFIDLTNATADLPLYIREGFVKTRGQTVRPGNVNIAGGDLVIQKL